MAIAFTAWLMAPAPIACTSTRLWLRTTPAIAPATATGLDVAETFRISIAARAARGTPAAGLADNVFSPVEPFDGGVLVSRVSIYSNRGMTTERLIAPRHLNPHGRGRQAARQPRLPGLPARLRPPYPKGHRPGAAPIG